ncbi:DMT family transporter [Alkalihalobacillus sp. LMS39]|uniref:DMT family transporter n=1 Tax=Alkalihalobacillus sp. LMS39 TaxID=2924032 RepID=UPI001FB1C91D|nr:DMT family transporter [Alkalihalobacillus sp. LMS39]UOE96155.1 DMT family transporter [Alkalihalobacillus sp. LMS39]
MIVNSEQKSYTVPLVLSIILISFSAIFVKWSEAPPTILAMYRMWFACVFLLPVLWIKRKEIIQIHFTQWSLLFCSGIFLALHFGLWFASLTLTTVASSTIILALQPIIALIGGFFIFKERTTTSAITTMTVAIIGAMMVGWGDFGLSDEAILGDILSFLSVIAVVGYLMIGQNIVQHMSHWIYSFSVFFFTAFLLTGYNLVAHIPLFSYESREWGLFVLLAIIPTLAHLIHNWLLRYMNATTISMSILGEPVGATILAVLLLGEKLVYWQLIGGVLVLIGVFLFLIQQQKQRSTLHEKSA